jgi:hypothetical protein
MENKILFLIVAIMLLYILTTKKGIELIRKAVAYVAGDSSSDGTIKQNPAPEQNTRPEGDYPSIGSGVMNG